MLENFKSELSKIGNAARAQLMASGIKIDPGLGFRKDLFDTLLSSKRTLASVLLELDPVPTEALEELESTADLMDKVANASINDQGWPPALNPQFSIGIAALEKAHQELRLWDQASFEQRMQAIFKYLGADARNYDDWCAAFVSWCLGQVPPVRWKEKGIKRQSSLGALRLFEKFKNDPSTAECTFQDLAPGGSKPGDIVFWKRADAQGSFGSGYGHIGFVFAASEGRVTTLEGNSSVSVGLHEYTDGFDKSPQHQFHGIVRLP